MESQHGCDGRFVSCKTMEERFWEKVKKGDGCWIWSSFHNEYGYGQLRFRGRMRGAHRASWEINCGPIPDGLFVLHKCDNPGCVNPNHLFLGTNQDNLRDASNKGRLWGQHNPKKCAKNLGKWKGVGAKGSKHHHAKLTEYQVIEMRKEYATMTISLAALGHKYGVHESTAWDVVSGRRWKHVGGIVE